MEQAQMKPVQGHSPMKAMQHFQQKSPQAIFMFAPCINDN
jgi:hypothetical protein